jgi:hypothetical protein
MYKLRNNTTIIGAASLIAAAFFFQSGADAIPASQRSCSVTPNNYNNLQTISSAQGWQPVAGIIVQFHRGLSPNYPILQFSADAGVDADSEIRLGYSIDGGPVQFFGPQNFANHTQYWQTRYNLSVVPIGYGDHSIRPFWKINGSAGKKGVLDDRCLTLEQGTR